MGIFTNNGFGSLTAENDYPMVEVAANEAYDNVTGCGMALIENTMNDYALFEGILASDFQEVAAVHEGYEVVNESAGDILAKVKEMFKKLLSKIKGIFQAFLAKLLGTLAESDKLYNKYLKVITRHTDWEGFKIKGYRAVKGGGDVITKITSVDYKVDAFNYNTECRNQGTTNTLNIERSKIKKDGGKDYTREDLIEKIISVRVPELKGADKISELEKEYMDTVYDDAETKDDWSSGDFSGTNIGGLLYKNAGKKFKTAVESANSSLTKAISKVINELDKVSKDYVKTAGDVAKSGNSTKVQNKKIGLTNSETDFKDHKGLNKVSLKVEDDTPEYLDKDTKDGDIRRISFLQRLAGCEQDVIVGYTNARLKVTKFAIAQARRIWSSAAAYASRKHEGVDYELYTAIGEASAFDFTSDMESRLVAEA